MTTNTFKPLFRLSIPVLGVAILALSLRALHSGPAHAPDFPQGNPGSEKEVEISNGETGSETAKKLFELGIVKSSEAYFRVAVGDPRSSRVAPGVHLIESRIPARQALEQLLDKNRIRGLITVADGARLSEVVTEMVNVGYSKNEIIQAFSQVQLPFATKTKNPEGFLYPAHYSFVPGTTAREVLSKMVATFTAQTSTIDFTKNIEGFTGYQLLIIASLVQAEADPVDYRKVARVIYNRLTISMPLQLDTTVHYVLQRRGEITLALKDTRIKSAYNTYQHYGLPPGPIGSPTKAALEAVLSPASGDWLYFITVAPGDTRFTRLHDEFLMWKKEYLANVKSGLFKGKR